MSKVLEEYKDIYEGFLKRARDLIVDGHWYEKENRFKFQIKKDDFNHVQNATEAVVDALETLIGAVEGERDKPGVQPYIRGVVSTINIHLDRISKYYPKNKPSDIRSKEHKREEGTFQQHIFKGEQKIKSKLKGLNIDNDMSDVSIDFFDKVLATIPMRKVLCDRNEKIRAKVESLDIDWDIILDNGLFINMHKRDIPEYNSSKHFWDQDIETLRFWVSEYNKCVKGYTIDGYKMTPSLYFHINFFKTPIKNLGNKITNPPLRDNEWYFDEIQKYAKEKAKEMVRAGIIIYGTRRFSKTTQEVSHIHQGILANPAETGSVTSSNDIDLASIVDKLKKSLDYIVPAFRLNINSGKSFDSEVIFGIKSSSGRESYEHFILRITNTDGGSKKGSQKTAGGNPIVFISDEIGKSSFVKAYEAAIPSFESDSGWVCIPIYTGTGGEEDLSQDAEKVLANPTNYGFLEMNWDLLEYGIPKEAITWKRRPFGWFIPAQMSTYTGMRKIKTNFADFLGIDSEELRKIEFHQTDWIHNSKKITEIRSKLKGPSLTAEKVFRPIDPDECFMSAKTNPFPTDAIKIYKERIISETNEETGSGIPITLRRDDKDSSKIIYDITKKKTAVFPHPGGFVDAHGLLFGEFPETAPPRFRFIAGLDDYKHEESDGDSVGAFYIFDRIERKIVYSLASRPDPHGYLHLQIHMALDAWNAICFPENEDMKIKEYFDRLHVTDMYLGVGFDPYGKFSIFSNGNRKYGWQPDKNTAPFVRNLVVDYAKEIVGEGDIATQGFERIEDIQLLEEMIKYKEGGNFDRIVGFGSALLYDYYLTSKHIFPRAPRRIEQEDKDTKKQANKPIRNKYFTPKRRNLF